MAGRKWTKEEDKLLRANWPHMAIDGISELLNRTKSGIKNHARLLRLSSQDKICAATYCKEKLGKHRKKYCCDKHKKWPDACAWAGCWELACRGARYCVQHGAIINGLGRRKKLLPKQIKSELHHLVHFDKQRWQDKRHQIFVDCGCLDHPKDEPLSRWVDMNNIIRHDESAQWSGYCQECARKHLNAGPKSPFFIGKARKSGAGYLIRHIAAFKPNENEKSILMEMTGAGGPRSILEHRAVVALALGRPLSRDEQVHHINGDRADNHLENLQLVDHHKRPICPCCGWRMDEWPKHE